MGWVSLVFASSLLLGIVAGAASAQEKSAKPQSPAQLELTGEVAATTDEGYPAALRITVRNAGNLTVDMPVLSPSCHPDGGVQVRLSWTSDDPEDHTGYGDGYACGMSDMPRIEKRIENDWIRLRPGEFLTVTENIRGRYRKFKPGVVEYWVEYTPPDATPETVKELLESDHIVPSESLETPRSSFRLH